jgi:dihydroflavonol-4-reductase
VVRGLLEQGREVRALIEPGASQAALDALHSGVDRVVVDVVDGAAMARALAGCESFYHLAAVYKIWAKDPDLIHRVNVEGTTASLLAAQRAGVRRVVYTSSIAAVGLKEGGEPSDETVPFNLWPIASPYVATKHLSERIALQFAAAGLPLVVVNPAMPFGPGDRAPTPTGRILLGLLRGEIPGYTAGGFSIIDVDDCAAGHLLAEERGRTGERYLLTNHNVTVRDFLQQAAKIAGVRAPLVRIPGAAAQAIGLGMELWADHVSHREPQGTLRAVRYAQRLAFFDNRKARVELGLPTRPLAETIERAVSFFRRENMV